MSAVIVKQALVDHLRTITAASVTLPNEPVEVPVPRYVLQRGPTAQIPLSVSGDTQTTTEITVLCETALEAFDLTSDQLVQALMDHFPVGPLGDIYIINAPVDRPPRTVGGVYSVPVIIEGRGYF